MRISLRDQHGKELDFARVADVRQAPAEAMLLLAKFGCLYPGSLVSFDDDKPRQEPGTLMTLTVGNLQSLAGRLEQRAGIIVLAQLQPKTCGRPRVFAGTPSKSDGSAKQVSPSPNDT
jgi:hypothetical protein